MLLQKLKNIVHLLEKKDFVVVSIMIKFGKWTYHFIKKSLYSFPVISYYLDDLKSKKLKQKENKALDALQSKGFNVYKAEYIYNLFKNEKHKTCHIIGGGWSLNDSIHKIKKDDFVIGMNYSALADIDFDLYFIEQGLSDENETKIRVEFLEKIIKKQAKYVFFKNAYGNHCIDEIIKFYGGKVDFIRTYPLFCKNNSNASRLVSNLIKADNIYLKQFRSTIITSLIFAINLGFKEIIIHGLDFGGKYFYESSEIKESKRKYLPPQKSLSRGQKIHQTTLGVCGIELIISEILNMLSNKETRVKSGSSISPLTKIIKQSYL